jgi:hypothetical protein
MPRRFWRRLAGCIAIKCLLAGAPDYRAGTAEAGGAKAVVLEDRRGSQVVFADTASPITRPVADFVAAQLVRNYGLDRAGILLHGGSGGPTARAEDLITAISAALGHLEPANISYSGSTISVRAINSSCRASLSHRFRSLCRGQGRAVSDPVRVPNGGPHARASAAR